MLNKGYILDNKYKVIKVLGVGGMGTVYLCENTRLNNLWAIKETNKNNKIDIDITNEPNILKNLNHPGIPKIIDIFYENNNFYMVEEYIEGQTLKEYVKVKGCLELSNICHIISNICEIIKYLHGFNPPIIYRDVKPSNIMITPNGKVVLIDFGISKIYKFDNECDTVNFGSNGYAAPEQSGLQQSCMQTDIYGIGMVMYFLTTGKASQTAAQPLENISYPNNTNKDLKKIIFKCVQSQIKDRYTTTDELNIAIMALLNKNNDDKTLRLNNINVKSSPKTTKSKLRLILVSMMLLVAIISVSIYFLYANKKGYTNNNGVDKTTLDTTVPAALPAAKSITPTIPKAVQPATTPSTNSNANKNLVNQNQVKEKGHGKRK